MNGLRQFEAAVEREARWLRTFPDPAPSPGAADRLIVALHAARRARRRADGVMGRMGVVAATLLLGVGLLWQMSSADVPATREDPSAALRDWGAAMDDTTFHVDRLVTHAWLPDGDSDDADEALDDAIKSLDAALDLGA